MMACVCAISSWGLGTRGTTGGRMVAVPVDCKTNHMVSIEIILNHLCAIYEQTRCYWAKLLLFNIKVTTKKYLSK